MSSASRLTRAEQRAARAARDIATALAARVEDIRRQRGDATANRAHARLVLETALRAYELADAERAEAERALMYAIQRFYSTREAADRWAELVDGAARALAPMVDEERALVARGMFRQPHCEREDDEL